MNTESTRRAFNVSGEIISKGSWLLILKRKHRGLWRSGEISEDWKKTRRTEKALRSYRPVSLTSTRTKA